MGEICLDRVFGFTRRVIIRLHKLRAFMSGTIGAELMGCILLTVDSLDTGTGLTGPE